LRWPESTPEETHEWYIANTLIAADAESSTDPRVKSAFFIVEQDGEQLAAPGKLFDSGELKAFVKAELPMEEADHAYSDSIAGNPGKLIIRTKEFRPTLSTELSDSGQ
jgi:hypothetical protein